MKSRLIALIIAGEALAGVSAYAASLMLTGTAPIPGPNDIYNFAGASRDGLNVGNYGTDGANNDFETYVSYDRADQGQTLSTGSNPGGYLISSIWVQHVGYTNNGTDPDSSYNGTWWQMGSGSTFTIRVTAPSAAGTANFALHTETYSTTGAEGWPTSAANSANGDGEWLHFTFSTPFILAPQTTYGFDLTVNGGNTFFEWLGTGSNVFSGTAYNGNTTAQSGGPDNILNPRAGDRVFLVSLTPITNPPMASNPLVAVPFNLTNVTLLPSQFQTNMLLDKAYLLSLNPDSLLYNYRANMNLSTSNAPALGGWETPGSALCLGHFTGHYLSACSMMYASTGDPQLKARTDYIVAQLANCQAASPAAGYNTGYLAAFPEYYIDDIINETQNSYFAVPWYTIHKVMAGLLDTYQYTGNQQALTVLTNMANWVQFRMSQLSASQIQAMLNYREYGGMNEVLANLYGVTGNTNYLQLASDFDKQSLFVPLSEGQDVLDGLHDNTQIPEIIGASREYELTGSSTYYYLATFFWNRVANYRSFVIGGSGDEEFFFPTSSFPSHLSPETCETCCTYNILKLTRHLFEWQPSAAYMDFYERGLYNQILGSQEPLEGMMTYFVSLEPGHFKTYSTPTNSFWCCEGTGVENHSKYADTIYFHSSNSLYLNLFIPSVLNWPDKGLIVTQNTSFPQSDTSTLTFQCTNNTPLTLYVRYPAWAQSGMSLSINSVSQSITNSPGSYVSVNRMWQSNDQVQITLPMSLRTETLQDTTNEVALFYGPILLAGALGTNGMPSSDFASGQLDLVSTAVPDGLVPMVVSDIPTLLSNIVPVSGQPLNFQTVGLGQPRDFNLMPFYQVQHQRYSVYWSLISSNAWQQFANSNAMANASVEDQVNIGDPVSEAAHGIVAVNSTTGNFNGLNWRDADEDLSSSGGSFSYVMAIIPNVASSVACTFWGSDTGAREFNILVNGTIIGNETLTNDDPGQFFTVNYPIPSSLTAGNTNVTVEFQSYPNEIAGGVFGLQTITTASPGTFLGINMSLSSKQTMGGVTQLANVTDFFQNLANHLITPSLWLTMVSSDTNVIVIGPNNQLIAVGPGTTTITASYMGKTVSQIITVSQPALSIAFSGTNAVVSWPSNAAGLQSGLDFAHFSGWSPYTNSIIYNNGTNTLTIPVTNASRFFRLSQ